MSASSESRHTERQNGETPALSDDARFELRRFALFLEGSVNLDTVPQGVPVIERDGARELSEAGLVTTSEQGDMLLMTLTEEGNRRLREMYAEDSASGGSQVRLLAASPALAALIERLADPHFGSAVWQYLDGDPQRFLDDGFLAFLGEFDQPTRLAYLAEVSQYFCITPESVAQRYFVAFPGDAATIGELFLHREGTSRQQSERCLFNVALPYLCDTGFTPPENLRRRLNAELDVSTNRSIAPSKLVALVPLSLEPFGAAGDQFDAVFEWGRPVRYLTVNTNRLFGEPFEQLPPRDQSAFLMMALSNIQYAFVARDCYHPRVTRDDVIVENSGPPPEGRSAELMADFRHSILHGSEHPNRYFHDERDRLYEPDLTSTRVDPFPNHRIAIRTLRQFAEVDTDPETRRLNCDAIIDFWDKNRSPVFCAAVAHALSSQDPAYAAGKILEMINSSSGYRNHLASLLYRIELGRMGISEEGVQYLGRIYDLQELNRPGYFVQRLTAQGEMGVFDEERRLIRYFGLGDLTDGATSIRPELLEFTVRTLFFGGTGPESIEETRKREQWLDEFQAKYLTAFGDGFFEATGGVPFNNLSFREQGGYVHFVATRSPEEIDAAHALVREFGEPALKTFLSLQFDERTSDAIFAIAQKLPHGLADAVFLRYSALADAVDEAARFCREHFGDDRTVTDAMLDDISVNLLRNARELLAGSAEMLGALPAFDAATNGSGPSDAQLKTWDRVCTLLQCCHEQVSLFTESFKVIKASAPRGSLRYDDVRDCSLEIIASVDLGDADREQMLAIARDRTNATYSNPVFREVALETAEAALEARRDDEIYYFVKFGTHVIAFCRSEPWSRASEPHDAAEEGALYLGSLNNNRFAQNSGIGMALAEDVTQLIGDDAAVFGYVAPDKGDLAEIYIRRLGFERHGNHSNGGIRLRRPPDLETGSDA